MADPYEELDSETSIVEGQGRPTPYFLEFDRNRQILIGTGSPEGVVAANPTQLYMDDAGASGSILYIKQTGTGNTGWVLV